MSLTIREAQPGEAGVVHSFIVKLAEYEKLASEVVATEGNIHEALFGATPRCICDLAFWNQEPAGFALWFYNFSTFSGKAGIYLEDLFVEPHLRGHGIGKALLRHLAQRCVKGGLRRLQWWVLDWNKPSIEFYKSIGAQAQDEWTVFRVSGEALKKLAQ
jgi:diamine N-acetyltransferase